MGTQGSKENVPNTPDTPNFKSYDKLISSVSDPRSPADCRTPIFVQEDSLADPRSPATKIVERTPIFSIPEPVSPFVRFKMENPAYMDSPLSKDLREEITNAKVYNLKEKIVSQCTQESLTNKLENLSVTKHTDNEDKELETTNVTETTDAVKEITSGTNKAHQPKRRRTQKSSKGKQSLLKQALFKPYVDDENKLSLVSNEHIDVTPKKSVKKVDKHHTPVRTPLGTRNFVVLTNENTSSAKKFDELHKKHQYGSENIARKILSCDSSVDKENMEY